MSEASRALAIMLWTRVRWRSLGEWRVVATEPHPRVSAAEPADHFTGLECRETRFRRESDQEDEV